MDGDVDAAIEYLIAERLAVSTDDAEVDLYINHAFNGECAKLS
jgi:OTU domain-containing protein 3